MPGTVLGVPTRAPAFCDTLAEIEAACRSLEAESKAVTYPHASWGVDMADFPLAPLNYAGALHLATTALSLLAGPGLPPLDGTRRASAEMRGRNAMCADRQARAGVLQLEWHAGYQRVCAPLLSVLEQLHANDNAPARKAIMDAVSRTFIAVLARNRMGFKAEFGGAYTQYDYDILTLPWRCRIGPLHPDDDNDVCHNPVVEYDARVIQMRNPGVSRAAARVQAALESE